MNSFALFLLYYIDIGFAGSYPDIMYKAIAKLYFGLNTRNLNSEDLTILKYGKIHYEIQMCNSTNNLNDLPNMVELYHDFINAMYIGNDIPFDLEDPKGILFHNDFLKIFRFQTAGMDLYIYALYFILVS